MRECAAMTERRFSRHAKRQNERIRLKGIRNKKKDVELQDDITCKIQTESENNKKQLSIYLTCSCASMLHNMPTTFGLYTLG